MKKSSIVARNLTYTVFEGSGERNILNHIDCEIESSTLTTVTGPSGSGKTTFMYALAGLLNISEGEVLYSDNSIYKLKQNDRDLFRLENISFIYQHLNLFGFMNVEENITLNYTLRKKKITPEISQKIDWYLELMKLGKIRKKEIQSLSGGEKQRIAIIRAFISKAEFIFAGEPTGNLDYKNSLLFMECLKDIMKENHSTVILVTHNKEINDYGDQKITLMDGNII